MSIFLHCREDTHSDSSLIQQDERTDYSTEKVEIPHTASFVDPNDPALFVGKGPLSDDENMTLLTSKFNPLTANDALPNYPLAAEAVNAVT